MLNNTQGS